MSQSRKKILERLDAALRDRSPVTIRRERLDIDATSGFIVAITEDWVVMQDLTQGVYLDDFVALRLDLVTRVESFRAKEKKYVIRAVAGLGVPVRDFECASDASIGDLLAIADTLVEIVGVHVESPKGGDWINFGKIHRIGKKRLDLQFIGRDGDWVDYTDRWRLKDITRLEFGGRYGMALEKFGDPMPPSKRTRRK